MFEDWCVEYSGICESGKRIMGLAKTTSIGSKYERDKHLTWVVPEFWSLEDACTVPLTYLQVRDS